MLTRITAILTLVLLLALAVMPAAAQDITPTEAPLPSETPLPTLTPTDIPTPIPTETPTATATATATETSTATFTESPTLTETLTETPLATLSETATATVTSESLETASPSPTLIETPSATATLSPSPSPTATATRTLISTGTPNARELTRAAEPNFRALSAPQVIERVVGDAGGLIDAIDEANNDPSNIYVIHLAPGTYTFDSAHSSPLTPDYYSYMPILGQVIIVGDLSYFLDTHPEDLFPDDNAIIARADNSDQLDLFHVSGGSLTLYNVIVRNGGGPDRWGGGGFVVWGSLNLYNSVVDDNFVSTYGGAIYNESGGVVTSSNTIFRTNSAFAAGGAIYNPGGTLLLDCTYFDDNEADEGGAIYNTDQGEVTVDQSNFEHNSGDAGAAIFNAFGPQVLALNSWWNSSNGPSLSLGADDSVAGDVIFTPYQAGFVSLGCAVPPLPAGEAPVEATQTAEAQMTQTTVALTQVAQAQATGTAQAQMEATQTAQAQSCDLTGNPVEPLGNNFMFSPNANGQVGMLRHNGIFIPVRNSFSHPFTNHVAKTVLELSARLSTIRRATTFWNETSANEMVGYTLNFWDGVVRAASSVSGQGENMPLIRIPSYLSLPSRPGGGVYLFPFDPNDSATLLFQLPPTLYAGLGPLPGGSAGWGLERGSKPGGGQQVPVTTIYPNGVQVVPVCNYQNGVGLKYTILTAYPDIRN